MSDTLLACRDCGQVHRAAGALAGLRLACVRCGRALARRPRGGLDRPLALATTALILLLVANYYPLFTIDLEGRQSQGLIVSGAVRLAEYGGVPGLLGLFVALVTFALPIVQVSLVVIVLGGLCWSGPALRPRLAPAWRAARWLAPWSMLDVYLLAAFVAYTRLRDAADTTIGTGGYALAALVVVMALLQLALGIGRVWDALADPRPHAPRPGEPWVLCRACQLVVARRPRPPGSGRPSCPRCGAWLAAREPASLAVTVAMMLAAVILYVPANVLPVLSIERFGRATTHTILSGVAELARLGMWPLALIVFFASIVVPLMKLVSLGWFLVAIRRRSAARLRERTVLYRLIDFVGRWSNIDVFMVSILAGLLQFGALTTVDPGPGIPSFAAVVVLTMIATRAFDARLMWDAAAGGGG